MAARHDHSNGLHTVYHSIDIEVRVVDTDIVILIVIVLL